MVKIIRISLMTSLILFTMSNCKKEEEATPKEMLEGKWKITSQEILGSTLAGDGSYLTFASDNTGTDYKSSDQTTGLISYTLNDEATLINIVDTMSDGGNYNYNWDILELNETSFRITASTFLGNLKIEMEKE